MFSATLLPIKYYKGLLTQEEDKAVYADSPFDNKKRGLFVARDVSTKYSRRNAVEYKKIADYIKKIVSAKEGNYLFEISAAIGDYCESFGYGVVRDLVGHGIGHALHEDPQIPNFRQRSKGIRLVPGMTLAIEPMVNEGDYTVEVLDDDWTIVTADGSLSAHYENTVLVTKDGYEILTL